MLLLVLVPPLVMSFGVSLAAGDAIVIVEALDERLEGTEVNRYSLNNRRSSSLGGGEAIAMVGFLLCDCKFLICFIAMSQRKISLM